MRFGDFFAIGGQRSREAGNATLPDFAAQCEAMLEAGPPIISSIMGLYPDHFVTRMKANGIKWFATATTVSEAKAAEDAGADVIIAQGMEAGGHRGAFDATKAEARLVGLFSLLPAVADAVKVPVVAAGGIGDGRGLAAALLLGASAVQVGTAFLRCPEAKVPGAWADAIGRTLPEETMITRWFSGRPGRSIATGYVRAAADPTAPAPAPYPIQRGLTQAMRDAAIKENDIERIQAWAGQSARMAKPDAAGDVVRRLWDDAQALLQVCRLCKSAPPAFVCFRRHSGHSGIKPEVMTWTGLASGPHRVLFVVGSAHFLRDRRKNGLVTHKKLKRQLMPWVC